MFFWRKKCLLNKKIAEEKFKVNTMGVHYVTYHHLHITATTNKSIHILDNNAWRLLYWWLPSESPNYHFFFVCNLFKQNLPFTEIDLLYRISGINDCCGHISDSAWQISRILLLQPTRDAFLFWPSVIKAIRITSPFQGNFVRGFLTLFCR
jgi:hypothetical protein